MGVIVTNIQRMCFHDGPGIRTTVFLKGCGIHCPWCANPENLSFAPEYGYDAAKCRKQEGTCLYNADCIILERPDMLDAPDIPPGKRTCPLQAIRLYGRAYEADELIQILEKDAGFWGEDGGVTFSGGEPLLQASGLLEVWRRLKEKKVHMAVETSLFVPRACLESALDYIDFFYVDIKLLDKELCRRVLGGDVEVYLENLQLLAERGGQIHFRIPISEEYVRTQENWEAIRRLLQEYPAYPVQIFRIHDLGESKYKSLGMEMERSRMVSDQRLEEAKSELEGSGIQVEIICI